MKFAVIGAMNMDVTGWCPDVFRLHDSNPGYVHFTPGGIGRNVAAALAALGHSVYLIAPITRDIPGQALAADCARVGIELSHARYHDGSAPCYMALHTPDGDMLGAVNDMGALLSLTPAAISEELGVINSCDACVCEANLTEEALNYLCENVNVPVIADAVSVYKCNRLSKALWRLDALKPNLAEAKALSQGSTPEECAQMLLDAGVKRVVISLGADGVYAADKNAGGYIKPTKVFSCSTNGAGDALAAGIAVKCAQGEDALKCAAYGMQLSRQLLEERSKN